MLSGKKVRYLFREDGGVVLVDVWNERVLPVKKVRYLFREDGGAVLVDV